MDRKPSQRNAARVTEASTKLLNVWKDGQRAQLETVPFVLVRNPRRREYGIVITDRLEVRGPADATIEKAERLLWSYSDWVFEHYPKDAMPTGRCRDGGRLPFRGGMATLRLGMSAALAVPVGGEVELWLPVPKDAPEAEVRAALRELLKREARRVITDCWMRVHTHAPKLPVGWRLSCSRRSWGCCTRGGNIRLSWRLIALPDVEIEYVIAHELAHLQVFDHSKRFWEAVGRIYPDWEAPERRLDSIRPTERLDDV